MRHYHLTINAETILRKDKTMENFPNVNKADRKIRSYRLKSLHRNYIEGYITYFDYREVLWLTINKIRKSLNLKEFSEGEFDKAWQYRTMAHETWKGAHDEILSTILGVW